MVINVSTVFHLEAISKILPRVHVMPDLFRHSDFLLKILRSRNVVRDDKVFLRWLLTITD